MPFFILNGFFTFVKNRPRLHQALIDQDYLAFSTSYKGPGQAARYRDLIKARIIEFVNIDPLRY